jgi:uncharacterized protein (TIGR02996 family)
MPSDVIDKISVHFILFLEGSISLEGISCDWRMEINLRKLGVPLDHEVSVLSAGSDPVLIRLSQRYKTDQISEAGCERSFPCRFPGEEALLDSILKLPNDAALRLAFENWLVARGDPRAELLRLLHKLVDTITTHRQGQPAPRLLPGA